MQLTTNFLQIFPTCLLLLFSFTLPCLTLCNPMTCSMLGIPDLHYSPEFAQTHVHWVSDAIQPCRPVTPFSFLPPVFPSIGVFPSESALCIRWLEYWSFSFSISPSNKYYRVDFPQDWLVCSPCCPRDSSILPSTTVWRHQFFGAQLFFFFFCPAFTPIHDYWKNHSFCLLSQGNY